jgi:hypothetical protein
MMKNSGQFDEQTPRRSGRKRGVDASNSSPAIEKLEEVGSVVKLVKKSKTKNPNPPNPRWDLIDTKSDEVCLNFWYDSIQDSEAEAGVFYHDKSVSSLLNSPNSIVISVPMSFEDIQTSAARVYKATYGINYEADKFHLGLILPSTSEVRGRKKKFHQVQILSSGYTYRREDHDLSTGTKNIVIIPIPKVSSSSSSMTAKVGKGKGKGKGKKISEESSDEEGDNQIRLKFILGGAMFNHHVLAEVSNRTDSPCVELGRPTIIEEADFPLNFDVLRDFAQKVYVKKQDKELDFDKFDLYKMTLAKSPSNDAKMPHQMMLCEHLDERYTRNRGGDVTVVIFDKATVDGKHGKKSGSASDPARVKQLVIGQMAASVFASYNTSGTFPVYMQNFHLNVQCTNRDLKVGAVRNLFYCAGDHIPNAQGYDWSNAMSMDSGERAIHTWLQNFDVALDPFTNVNLPNGITFRKPHSLVPTPLIATHYEVGMGNESQFIDKVINTRIGMNGDEQECTVNNLKLLHQVQLARDYGSITKRYKGDWFTVQKIALNPKGEQQAYLVLTSTHDTNKISLPINAFFVEDPIMEEDVADPEIEKE